jgi:hypothetical protein
MPVIGEREIMIDVLPLPEMSCAERAAGRAKQTDNFHCPAALRRRRRHRGDSEAPGPRRRGAGLRHRAKPEQLSIAGVATLEGGSLFYCAFPLLSCQQHLGTRPGGLAETPGQAVTVLRVPAPRSQ